MKIIKAIALGAMVSLVLTGIVAAQSEGNGQMDRTNAHLRILTDSKVAFRIGDRSFTVTLYDNPTANDLLEKLPLTVQAGNYPGYDEKVIRLREPLSMEGAPEGDNPEIPEVGYYEPGNWIALYYGPIGYWPGKVPLGRIDASVDELAAISDGAAVTIEALTN